MTTTDHLVIGTVEAADMLGVSRETVARWAANGKLPPLRKLDGLTGGFVFEAGTVRRKAAELAAKRSARAS